MENTQSIIQPQQYHADNDEAIIEAIKNRVFVYEPGIIYIKEIPVPSPFTVNLVCDQALELGKQFDKWSLIVDITETKRPDAKTRRVIFEKFTNISKGISHIAYYTNGILFNTIIRFVMYGLENSYSVNHDFNKVIKSAKTALV